MIFGADALLALVAEHAARLRVPVHLGHGTLCTIVAEAEDLAGGCEEDEPAALFYTFARHAAALGKLGSAFFDDVAVAQAAAVGLSLQASELDLILLRGRIAFGAAPWDAVRQDFAGWLSPATAPSSRTAPKRPR